MIDVKRTANGEPLEFEVVIRDATGESRHHVSMSNVAWERMASGRYTPERCIEAAFRFLLDRESRASILARFDVTAISRYFPDFERELPRYLSHAAD